MKDWPARILARLASSKVCGTPGRPSAAPVMTTGAVVASPAEPAGAAIGAGEAGSAAEVWPPVISRIPSAMTPAKSVPSWAIVASEGAAVSAAIGAGTPADVVGALGRVVVTAAVAVGATGRDIAAGAGSA